MKDLVISPSLREEVAELREQVVRLRAELAKWPRVFWKSYSPESSEEGLKVVSVAGRTGDDGDVYVNVYVVDKHGEELLAADEVGLYPSREELEAAQ